MTAINAWLLTTAGRELSMLCSHFPKLSRSRLLAVPHPLPQMRGKLYIRHP